MRTKNIGIILGLMICLGLSGCKREENKAAAEENDSRLCVATTLFPYYDFVRQIAGDRVKLKLVVPAGMNSHSFEPTPADMLAIQHSDIFFYNGGDGAVGGKGISFY